MNTFTPHNLKFIIKFNVCSIDVVENHFKNHNDIVCETLYVIRWKLSNAYTANKLYKFL